MMPSQLLSKLNDMREIPEDGWRRIFPPFVFVSPGIKLLMENDGKGFIDIVASYQPSLYIAQQDYHQHWTITNINQKYWEIRMHSFYYDTEKIMQTVSKNEMNFPFDIPFTVHVGYLDERICGICLLGEED